MAASNSMMQAIVKISGELDQSLSAAVSSAQKSVSGIGSAATKAGQIAVAGIAAATTAAAAFGVACVNAAGAYEEAFAKTATLLSGDEEALSAYSQSIIDLSNSTGVAASELTETVYQAISAGVSQEEAIGFAEQAAKLSAGGFTDASTAVDVMTTALNAYGDESGLTAEKVSDLLITTQNLGKTSVDELASSVGKVIPVASAYGVEMDNLSAAYAALTAGGISTAESGTYLKAMLNELGDSGSTVSQTLVKQTGKSFAELTKDGASLGDIMEILGESVDGDSGKFNELWSSSEAGVGALSLLGTGAEEYNSILGEMQDSAGATDSAYQTMTGTFSHQIEVIKNLGQNFMISVGEMILPYVTTLAESAIPAIQSAIETVLPVIQNVIDNVGPAFGKIWDTVSEAIGGVVDNGFNPLETAMNFMKDTVFPAMQDVWQFFIDEIAPAMGSVLDSVKDAFGRVVDALDPVVSGIENLAQTVWPYFKDVAYIFIDTDSALLSGAFDLVATGVEAASTGISTLIDWITPLVQTYGPDVVSVFGFVFDKVQQVALIVGGALSTAFKTIHDIFNDKILPVVDNVKTKFTEFKDLIVNTVQPVIEGFKSAIDKIAGAFDGVVSGVSNALSGLADVVKAPINAVIRTINTGISHLNQLSFDLPEILGGGHVGLSIPLLSEFATGGFTNGPSIAGEAGTEAVISFLPQYRDDNISYWAQAGQMLGLTADDAVELMGGQTSTSETNTYNLGGVTFAPQITIEGSASEDDVIQAIRKAEPEFFDLLDKYLARKESVTYAPAF